MTTRIRSQSTRHRRCTQLVIILSIANLLGCQTTPSTPGEYRWAGGKLTYIDADRLNEHLEKCPDDWRARLKSIGYMASLLDRANGAELSLYLEMDRIINAHPTMDLTSLPYASLDTNEQELIKITWEKQLSRHPNDLAVIENVLAFRCYSAMNNPFEVEELARKAMALYPDTWAWLEMTRTEYGNAWRRSLEPGVELFKPEEYAADELRILDELIARKHYRDPEVSHAMRADALYRCGRAEEATAAARAVIDSASKSMANESNHAWAVHHAHVVLGLLACDAQSWDRAERHLAASIACPLKNYIGTGAQNVDLRLVTRFARNPEYRTTAQSALGLMGDEWSWFKKEADSMVRDMDRGFWPDVEWSASPRNVPYPPGLTPPPKEFESWFTVPADPARRTRRAADFADRQRKVDELLTSTGTCGSGAATGTGIIPCLR